MVLPSERRWNSDGVTMFSGLSCAVALTGHRQRSDIRRVRMVKPYCFGNYADCGGQVQLGLGLWSVCIVCFLIVIPFGNTGMHDFAPTTWEEGKSGHDFWAVRQSRCGVWCMVLKLRKTAGWFRMMV